MSGGTVRLAVDGTRCVCVGQCELLEPEVFRVDDDEGIAVVVGGGRLPVERAQRVVESCPSGAISVVDG